MACAAGFNGMCCLVKWHVQLAAKWHGMEADVGSAFLSTGGDGDRQSARTVAIRSAFVLLAIFGINNLHFLIPKEFSRRRIRLLAIGLGIAGCRITPVLVFWT
jgi:hypothetical protein